MALEIYGILYGLGISWGTVEKIIHSFFSEISFLFELAFLYGSNYFRILFTVFCLYIEYINCYKLYMYIYILFDIFLSMR